MDALELQNTLNLNDSNLPYPDPMHPVVVHFVIAMVFMAFICDVVGYFFDQRHLHEVSFWNLFVATGAIFVAILFGQLEAGLATPYGAAQPVLNVHTLIGWSLGGILALITGWRFVIRYRNPLKVPPSYLGAATFLISIVSLQVFLGTQLVWEYGLHVKPVVEAMNQGILK